MAHWITVLLLAGAATLQQPSATPPQVDRVLRDVGAGRQPLDDVKMETQCVEQERFRQAAVHGNGVAIWDGEKQGTLTRDQVLALVKTFAREGFPNMPASFGEEEEGAARMSIKMTCRVRFAADGVVKDVIQLEKGDQSAALKRVAKALLDSARGATRSAPAIESLGEGLAAIGAGTLAVETLRVTMRSGAGRGARDADDNGWVLRLEGRDVEIETDAGARSTRRLPEPAVRDLARAMADSGFARLPANVRGTGYVDVIVSVLRHERNVQARQFSGSGEQDPAVRARFEQAMAPLAALRGR